MISPIIGTPSLAPLSSMTMEQVTAMVPPQEQIRLGAAMERYAMERRADLARVRAERAAAEQILDGHYEQFGMDQFGWGTATRVDDIDVLSIIMAAGSPPR